MIHPTAIIDPSARLGRDVRIGAYAVIGAGVELGDGCEIGQHAVIEGPSRLGPGNRIFPHACVGLAPQDLGFAAEATRLEVGARNVIREFVTIHRGTMKDRQVTRIGDDNLFMVSSHIAHDCLIGSHVVMANAATLAGHVTVGDHVNIAGLCAIHQYVRIGAYAMLGGGAMVPLDVPPFMVASGDRAKLHGLNTVGLRRQGFDKDELRRLKRAYTLLFRSDLRLTEAIEAVQAEHLDASARVVQLINFIQESKRGVTRSKGL